jgi:1,5-anhydro-D-fructose reductase (1,5-anhydro-D-mannitol-forming)
MASKTSPIRLGVVGCARILPAHLRGIAALQAAGLDPVRITALCARRIGDAEMFRRRGEGPPPRPPASSNGEDPLGAPHRYVSDLHPDVLPDLYDDWRVMLDDDVVDAVLVLAPVSLHHEVALAALSAGKHVLIEKPFAISVRAARAIEVEARRRGLVAGVAENLRYLPATRALGWVVDQGLVGMPHLWLSGGVGGEWAPDHVVAHTPWRHRKLEAGGGPAIDSGVHLMHQIRYIMKEVEEVSALVRTMEPTRVEGPGTGRSVVVVANEVEDVYLAQLSFASGAIGTVFSSWAGRGEASALLPSPIIYGTLGCIKGNTVVGDDGVEKRATDILANGAPTPLQEQYFPLGICDAFGLELLDFVRAIEVGVEMEANATEGVLDMAMAYAILESSFAAAPVRIADVLSGAVDGYQAEINTHYGL